ncbi:MAG: hypothetical protein EOP42_26135 [Sphingobacteriaceae bacterium]|nr:MAG: hypothetical protein EOP42_26135 [Sphingobacteriaceae bacterium]
MYAEIRKLHLIEELIKVDDDQILSALEAVLNESLQNKANLDNPFLKLAGTWSTDEAREIEDAISESCEKVNLDDWK